MFTRLFVIVTKYYCGCWYIKGDQKVSVHLTITVQKHAKIQYFKQFHHRTHSECGQCYTEHGLREHISACQMSGDWRGTLWTLLVTFCIVIIKCTETFWSPCVIYFINSLSLFFCGHPSRLKLYATLRTQGKNYVGPKQLFEEVRSNRA